MGKTIQFMVLVCLVTGVLSAQEGMFEIRLENVSGGSALPTPFAPGVWAVHATPDVLFSTDLPDEGKGLEALAEDGGPGGLLESIQGLDGVHSSGVFNQPVGADSPAPIFPGESYLFRVPADPSYRYLSFASMLVQSNDLFAAPESRGLVLFDEDGNPTLPMDRTTEILLWDAGTEVNEAPGMGPEQAPRQPSANSGAAEGGVALFTATTRAIPSPSQLVDVTVVPHEAGFTVTVSNRSASSGAMVTPIAPVFYALHNEEWSLFQNGEAASAGLEGLAEDGGPGGLVGEHDGVEGTGMVGAQPITDQRPGDDPGPAFSGESYSIEVPLMPTYPKLTIACMVVESNDAFLAFGSEGISLFNSEGEPRSQEMIEADIQRELAVWDAGTEINQVPGVGMDQPIRQSGPDTGAADPIVGVRLYQDATNDLAGDMAGGFTSLMITPNEDGSFEVRLRNQSDQSAYSGLLTPALWAVHSSDVSLFQVGEDASEGLEKLAEDGDSSMMLNSLQSNDGVATAGVANMPSGQDGPGPLTSGSEYVFTVMPTAEAPYLSIATMVVPSNDTFLAFGSEGLKLLDDQGQPRAQEDLMAEVMSTFVAWDAGTERNQAGAAGPDQAPRQAGPNTGADEGPGTVRVSEDPVWGTLNLGHSLKVTVRFIGQDVEFLRGDVNSDSAFDISDPMMALMYLFLGKEAPECLDSIDADDSGRLNITDPIYMLRNMFLGGPQPPLPGYESCGLDPTDDSIPCLEFSGCPVGN